jgi:putative phage-type endonuclease
VIIRDVEQGTAEWLALRAGRVTASRFGDVLAKGQGKVRRAYLLQLLAERLTGAPQPTYQNDAMAWGTEMEPRARASYELLTGREVEQVAMVIRDDDVGCSPDGLVGADGAIEIKCPNTTTHLETVLSKTLPATYKPQVQGVLWVSGRSWLDFVSFDPRLPESAQIEVIRVERDEDYIARLESEVSAFVEELRGLEGRFLDDYRKPERISDGAD